MKTEQITDGLDVGKIQRILNEIVGRDDRRLIDVQWAINELVGMIQRLALK